MVFEPSRPVFGGEFFNRTEELGLLTASIRHLKRGATRYLALLGPRKVGKTSLLRKFVSEIDDPEILSFFIDCWEKRPTPFTFFQDYLVQAIDAFLIQDPSTRGLAPLRAHLLREERFVAALADLRNLEIDSLRTASELLIEVRRRNFSDTLLAEVIDFPERLAQETNRRFVVILDEFQELQDLNRFKAIREYSGDIFALLRARWQTHQRVNYLVAGSRLTMMRKILTAERAPFFQHFKIVNVGPFRENDAKGLLRGLSHSAGRPIPEMLIDRTLETVGTNPFYLQVIGAELCIRDKIDNDWFKVVVQQTLFDTTGTLFLYFQDMVGRIVGRSASLERTLHLLATRPGPLSQIAFDLGVASGAAKSWIDRVADLVSARDGVYQIDDPALGLWLQYRGESGRALPPLVLGDEAEKAVARAMAAAGYELVYQSRASRGAFDLLAILGSKEIGVQVKKAEVPYYLGRDELERMLHAAKKLNWTPLLALVGEAKVRFYDIRSLSTRGKSCRIDDATSQIEHLLAL